MFSILFAKTKLNSEPINRGKTLNFIITGTQRSNTNFLLLHIFTLPYYFLLFSFTWENSLNAGSAKRGTCPKSSWQTSGSGVYLSEQKNGKKKKKTTIKSQTHNGMEWWRMYWVLWNTLNARPFKKSLKTKGVKKKTGNCEKKKRKPWAEQTHDRTQSPSSCRLQKQRD